MKRYFRTQEFLLRPSTSKKLILYSIVMLMMSASLTSGKATVSLELIRYDNPTHHELNGNCCEWVCWKFLQLGVCDNRFSLCIDEVYGYGDSESMDDCDYLKRDNFHSGNDEFSFPSTFESCGNPIVFEVPDYRGGIRVKIDIWDTEVFHRINPEDHVDFYTQDIFVKPSTTSYRTLYGRGSSTTDIRIQVHCASDFYDDNCSTYCTASDSDWKGHYTCDPSTGAKICRSGYEGQECNTDIDECKSSPCQNGGGCRDHLNYFTCECVEGTSGERCETILDKCYSNPCKNYALCINAITSFSCECADGFEGEFCETEIDECQSNPCQNSGSCVDIINGFQCDCVDGYNGLLCEKDVDECASGPCANGATCTDNFNGYSCSCADGFEGDLCETEINECQSNPCRNSGTCLDMINGFQCNCTTGYYGLLCETDHDDCASGPCSNGATCTDVLNGYVCECAPGFFGDHCKGSMMFIGIAAVVVMIILLATFLYRRHYYVRSYNLKSSIEHDPLLN